MASTITLQTVVNFCSTHGDLLPLSGVGGYTNEPALSLCNDALSELITDPNDWTFNRVEMAPFYTAANKQDYLFAGASAFTLSSGTTASTGWAIDLASNSAITVTAGVVTVKTIEPHRFAIGQTVYMAGNTMSPGTAANYNSVFTDNGTNSQWTVGWVLTGVTTNGFSFAATAGQVNADVGGAAGIKNFAYATSASMVDVNNNSSPPNITSLTVKRELLVSSRVSMPEKVCVLADLNTGVLKLRLLWLPSTATYAVSIVYQAQSPIKTALTDKWDPFPDTYSAVIRQSLLYRMYRYLNDSKQDDEYKKLQVEIAKTQATDDATLTDVGLQPEYGLMDDGVGWW